MVKKNGKQSYINQEEFTHKESYHSGAIISDF
jgi:hypothetical protein